MLKFREKTTKFIDYSDLEDFIQKTFGLEKRFEILESPNDTAYTFDVGCVGFKSSEISEGFDYLLRGNVEHWALGTVMDFLCTIGHLEPGQYVVEVSW